MLDVIKFFINKLCSAKLVRKGKCNRCGNCCRNIILSVSKNEPIMSESQFEEVKKWDKFFNNFYISGKDTSGVLLFTCKEIDEKNRCRVYWFRGLGCRLYPQPNVKYLINGGKMLDGCGFYFETNKKFKSFLKILFILFCITYNTGYAAEFDSSIDKDIRKQYNVNSLPTLPALPKVSPSKIAPKPDVPKSFVTYNKERKEYTLKRGTEITLVSKQKISNWSVEGTKISFVSKNKIITKEGIVIPSGTLFKGIVTDSHPPQITGNGGLIELKINEIHYNGDVSILQTKLKEANLKKVFHSDIKGKRKYWSNCAKSMTPGKKTFNAMKKAGKSMSNVPVISILSFVPFLIGGAVYSVNAVIAPVSSVFMKGGAITLPEGTIFQVVIPKDTKI